MNVREAREKNLVLRRIEASGGCPDSKRETFGDVVDEWLWASSEPKYWESSTHAVLQRLRNVFFQSRTFEGRDKVEPNIIEAQLDTYILYVL